MPNNLLLIHHLSVILILSIILMILVLSLILNNSQSWVVHPTSEGCMGLLHGKGER